jgi:hypothetical protein
VFGVGLEVFLSLFLSILESLSINKSVAEVRLFGPLFFDVYNKLVKQLRLIVVADLGY